MTEYNARIEWATRTTDDDSLVDELVDYHPAISRSERGWVEAHITLPAETLRQAATTALAIAEAASAAVLNGAGALVLEVLPTSEFDARNGLASGGQELSVTDAAAALNVSRQAVLQRLNAGTLSGRKVGNTWVVDAARAELLDAPGGDHVASVIAVVGQPHHHEGVEYMPLSGRSIQGQPTRYTYAPRATL